MAKGFRYDLTTGAPLVEIVASIDADFDSQELPGFGLIRYEGDKSGVWVEDGAIKPRELLALDETGYTMLLGDDLSIKLPAGCHLMHETSVLTRSGGNVVFSPAELGEARLRIVGRYQGPDIVVHVTSLDSERTRLRGVVDEKKAAVLDGGMSFADHVWDADAEAQESIKGAVQTAKLDLLPEGFYWTDRDNQEAPLSNSGVVALGQAIIAFGFACHDRAQVLKSMISNASSLDELMTLDIEAGWPS